MEKAGCSLPCCQHGRLRCPGLRAGAKKSHSHGKARVGRDLKDHPVPAPLPCMGRDAAHETMLAKAPFSLQSASGCWTSAGTREPSLHAGDQGTELCGCDPQGAYLHLEQHSVLGKLGIARRSMGQRQEMFSFWISFEFRYAWPGAPGLGQCWTQAPFELGTHQNKAAAKHSKGWPPHGATPARDAWIPKLCNAACSTSGRILLLWKVKMQEGMPQSFSLAPLHQQFFSLQPTLS